MNFGKYKTVCTRKPHKCALCRRVIPSGTEAKNYKGLFENTWQNWYECLFCAGNVEPSQVKDGEEITGDEFEYWFADSNFRTCTACEFKGNDFKFLEDETKLEITCCSCGAVRILTIPFTKAEIEE